MDERHVQVRAFLLEYQRGINDTVKSFLRTSLTH